MIATSERSMSSRVRSNGYHPLFISSSVCRWHLTGVRHDERASHPRSEISDPMLERHVAIGAGNAAARMDARAPHLKSMLPDHLPCSPDALIREVMAS